jgi:hypothetical protein
MKITNAAIRIGNNMYEGKTHVEVLEKARAFGERMDLVDRERDGLFRVSDGRIINRLQARDEFKISHSSQIAGQTDNLKEKTVLVYGLGQEVEFAIRLSRDFKKVYYYNEWRDGFPVVKKAMVGEGMEGIERVDSFFDKIDESDLVVFFDTLTGDIAEYLRKKGKRVFGCGQAEKLELNRFLGRKVQKTVGLPTQKTEKIVGMDNLRSHLKKTSDKFVKLNYWRGVIETFHHKDLKGSSPMLDHLSNELGSLQSEVEFIVEEPIAGDEWGYDGFVVDGKYPKTAMVGREIKDRGYVGKVIDYEKIPKPLKDVNDKLSPAFKKMQTRSFFSTEVRITKGGKGYLIDPTVRIPLPPGGLEQEIFSNFSEFIWYAAVGEMKELKTTAKYGVEVILESEWALKHYLEITIPKEIRQWVKLRSCCKIKGSYYAMPGATTVLSVVGLGNTLNEAIAKAEDVCERVDAFQLGKSFDFNSLREVSKESQKFGLTF